MIDGSSCSRMKFASLVVSYTIYHHNLCKLNTRSGSNLDHVFSYLIFTLISFSLSATLPNLRRVHLFWPPGGDRGPCFGGVPGGFPGGAGGRGGGRGRSEERRVGKEGRCR